ncbi:sodium/hydrogen exchanger 11-like [Tropilaelaps mercedesae]|uniref:Sodium/hydrogen exchanger 11-like n=1 Tax=Tropilaelaps mercedesae TaxID=418985 RepID=A0A1V9XWB8_9ACAR|nr:sodium/hydrogen exchanger 11-like [Tropilaelaps mercedesae]
MIAAHLPILVTVGGSETEESPGTGVPHGIHATGLFFSTGWAEKVRHLSVSSQFGKGHYRGGEPGDLIRKRSFSEHSTSMRHLAAARSKTLGSPASLPLNAADLELCERAEPVGPLPRLNKPWMINSSLREGKGSRDSLTGTPSPPSIRPTTAEEVNKQTGHQDHVNRGFEPDSCSIVFNSV